MTYAMTGLGVALPAVTVVASMARSKARDAAVTQLGPQGGNVFDAVDDLSQGMPPNEALRIHGVAAARQYLGANADEFQKTTGVPPAAVDALLNGLVTGDVKQAARNSASILGAALGTEACGPPCGMIVSAIAVGVVNSVDNFLNTWVLGDWDAQGRLTNQQNIQQSAQAVANLAQLTRQYSTMEDGLVAASQVAVARTYNDLLALGVTLQVDQVVQAVYDTYKAYGPNQAAFAPPWSRNPSLFRGLIYDGGYTPDMTTRAEAASKFAAQEQYVRDKTRQPFVSAAIFSQQNDLLRIEDTVLLAVRKAFVDAVKAATDAKYAGLWDRNKQESGFYDIVEKWKVSWAVPGGIPGGGTDPRKVPDGETVKDLFCTWDDAGIVGPCNCSINLGGGDVRAGGNVNELAYGPFSASKATCKDLWASPASQLPADQWAAPGFMTSGMANGFTSPSGQHVEGCYPGSCGPSSEYSGHTDYCFGGVATLRAWLCHYPRHFQWMATEAPHYGQQWAQIAVRDISLLQMTAALRKAKTSATIAAATAQAVAALKNLPLPAQQAAASAAANQAVAAHMSMWAQVRDAMMGKNWTTTQKAVAIGGAGVIAAVAIVLLL